VTADVVHLTNCVLSLTAAAAAAEVVVVAVVVVALERHSTVFNIVVACEIVT